jgi:DNA-binding GntR family transcriptional regulator
MLDKHKHIPLYIQLKDDIVNRIKEGIWEVDSQIPSEKALMDEYDVGRATVREAVSILVNEGYLCKKHGIGTFVARKQPSLGFEPLISLTYSLKARGVNAVNIVEDKKVFIPDKHLLTALKWKKKKPCLYLKRIRYGEDLALAIEESYFKDEFKDIGDRYDLTGSLAKIILQDLNISIKKVEQVIIPRMPTEEEQRKLRIDDSTIVLNLERWIYIDNFEEPFYYLKFVIPGNIYSFAP